jgi:hypothetical protein
LLKACFCCGHRTHAQAPGSTWQICEVCAFEDGGPERAELAVAQRHFAACGAADPELLELCTPSTGAPAPWHLPIDQEAAVLIPMLFAAFGDQDLDGGVSLEEAEHIDDYAMPARTLGDPPARGFGQSGPWHALTQKQLEKYSWCNFSFQDARGLRYHIPAYLRFFLEEPKFKVDPGSLLFHLESGFQVKELRSILTQDQKHVIARWLATQALDHWGSSARKALKRHWAADLDPEHADSLANVLL